jgi:hypothetical protein
MFGHYTYILPQHHVALESAIRSHSVISTVNAVLLARMYRLALDGLKEPVQDTGFFTSSIRASNVTLSSVTEAKTGLWVQLAKVDTQPGPYLTVGQKWAMEQLNPAQGNVSTVFWV